jgi:hypothetical protein
MAARDARPSDRSPWRAPSLARAASPAFPIARLPPKAKRLADRPQLLREMKQRSQRSRGNCQAPRTDIPRLSEGQLSSRPRRCSFATVAAVKGHED